MKEKIILPLITLISIFISGTTFLNPNFHIKAIGFLFLLIGIFSQYHSSKKMASIFRASVGTAPPKNSSEGDLFITYRK